MTPQETLLDAIEHIRVELERLEYLRSSNKLVEAQRLRQRTRSTWRRSSSWVTATASKTSRAICQSGRCAASLYDYLPADALLVIDESHVSVPQVARYKNDRSRKETLVEYGSAYRHTG